MTDIATVTKGVQLSKLSTWPHELPVTCSCVKGQVTEWFRVQAATWFNLEHPNTGHTLYCSCTIPWALTVGCWVTSRQILAHRHRYIHNPHLQIFGMGDSAVQRGNLGGRGMHVAPAWRRHHSRCSLSCAGAICHLREHLQTQGALVTQC